MLGLGLSASAAAVLAIKGWSPLMLGGALIEMFDPRREDLMTRPVGQQVSSVRGIKGVGEFVQATSAARPVWDAKAYGGVRNKCSNWSAAPTTVIAASDMATFNAAATAAGLGVTATAGDAGSLFAVLDYTAVLIAAGLQQDLDEGTINGLAYVIRNQGGATNAAIRANGTVGNTNPHTFTGLIWGGSGDLGSDGVSRLTFAASATPRFLSQTVTPFSGGDRLRVAAHAGQEVVFLFNDLREAASYDGRRIPVRGAPRWDFGRPGFVCDGVDDCFDATSVAWLKSGGAASEHWAGADNSKPASDAQNYRIFEQGTGVAAASRLLVRGVQSGVNRLYTFAGDGSNVLSAVASSVDFSGPHICRGVFEPTLTRVGIDGGGLFASGFIPGGLATTNTRARMFANSQAVGGNCFQGVGGLQAHIDPTHPNWTPENQARLLAYFQAY